jgi:hypothetical protein
VYNDSTKNPPDYQLVTLNLSEFIIVNLPGTSIAWRVTPLSVNQGGMPILVECNRNVVCDMSAVDGVNYLLKMELTATPNEDATTIDFNTNPCSVEGKGCLNPSVDGEFASGTTFSSAPCPYGTCNLINESRAWCQSINTGQCANVDSTWLTNERAATCLNPDRFTSYCYSHNDRNSSPPLVSPYKVKLTYSDL